VALVPDAGRAEEGRLPRRSSRGCGRECYRRSSRSPTARLPVRAASRGQAHPKPDLEAPMRGRTVAAGRGAETSRRREPGAGPCAATRDDREAPSPQPAESHVPNQSTPESGSRVAVTTGEPTRLAILRTLTAGGKQFERGEWREVGRTTTRDGSSPRPPDRSVRGTPGRPISLDCPLHPLDSSASPNPTFLRAVS
jgi:hypothetical protein